MLTSPSAAMQATRLHPDFVVRPDSLAIWTLRKKFPSFACVMPQDARQEALCLMLEAIDQIGVSDRNAFQNFIRRGLNHADLRHQTVYNEIVRRQRLSEYNKKYYAAKKARGEK